MAEKKLDKKQLREIRELIQDHKGKGLHETETVARVRHILVTYCGYGRFDEITAEKAIPSKRGNAAFMDLAVQLSGNLQIIVEVKPVDQPLSQRHRNQIRNYANDTGCPWILLTNGEQWELSYKDISSNGDVQEISSWNVLEDDSPDNRVSWSFGFISRNNVKKGGLEKWKKAHEPLQPNRIVEALFSGNVQREISRALRKATGTKPSSVDLASRLKGLLIEDVGHIADKAAKQGLQEQKEVEEKNEERRHRWREKQQAEKPPAESGGDASPPDTSNDRPPE